MLCRKTFFNKSRRSLFDGELSQPQVDGINADLDYWEQHYPDGNLQHLAYILATDYWETGRTMQPIAERGGKDYLTRMYDIQGDRPAKARELGNIHPGDGAKYTGGKIQLTGRRNFRIQGRKLNLPLEEQPELIYDMAISTAVLVGGMMDGDFTGHSLHDYTDKAGNLDEIKARRVVNGEDHAEDIATIYQKFLSALESAATIYAVTQAATAQQTITPANAPYQSSSQVTRQNAPVPETVPVDWADYLQWRQVQQQKAASKPMQKSKTLIAVLATWVSMYLARKEINLPPEQIMDIMFNIASSGLALIGILRVFFTNQAISR